jgi:hypothetical protein
MASMKQRVGLVAVAAVLACASTAQATSFTFNPLPAGSNAGAYPDISATVNSVNYAGGVLTICGQPGTLRLTPTPPPANVSIASPTVASGPCGISGFALVANITSGGALTSGNVTVRGGIPQDFNNNNATIFSAQLSAFNFLPSAGGMLATFDFLLNVISDPFNLGFGSSNQAGLEITGSTATSFLSNFSSGAPGTVDLFRQVAVPEPGSMLLLGTGLLVMFRRRLTLRKSSQSS